MIVNSADKLRESDNGKYIENIQNFCGRHVWAFPNYAPLARSFLGAHKSRRLIWAAISNEEFTEGGRREKKRDSARCRSDTRKKKKLSTVSLN